MKAMALQLPRLRKSVPLAPLTTYHIGGPADLFFEAHTAAELAQAVMAARAAHLNYFVLGSGANILIGDRGFRGLVIHNRASHVRWQGTQLSAESGISIDTLIRQSQTRGLSGLEHFAGIPSSLGGAIRQNLHFLSPDRQGTVFIASVVKSAKLLLADGQVRQFDRAGLTFGYDDSLLHHQPAVVLTATLELIPKSPTDIAKQIQANLAWRRAKQPQLDELASCGSVFKKIAGVGAGRLIEQTGLKGMRIGQVQVSPQHANYLVNLGGATAAQVRRLIEHVQQTVARQTGYQLEPEIGFIGDF
ncbi:UDP-N-acetylmuramate dehydrogenase [Candidatus Microgenomates bacterium]|nr:UDP-N-acetylmuramate dehydrogenase [Candidatus Microgenomates bacterium]